MRLWRLTRAVYANLSGEGAHRFGGRWNLPGRPAVYLAAEAALTVLEVRVHLDLPLELLPDDYVLLTIDADDLQPEQGPALTAHHECQAFGDRWLTEQRTALLATPSAIIPESYNVLLNPNHPDIVAVQIVNTRPWRFDPRLF